MEAKWLSINNYKGNCRRKRDVRTSENVNRVSELVKMNPNESIRLMSSRLDNKRESLRQIMTEDSNMRPYKIICLHELYVDDVDDSTTPD